MEKPFVNYFARVIYLNRIALIATLIVSILTILNSRLDFGEATKNTLRTIISTTIVVNIIIFIFVLLILILYRGDELNIACNLWTGAIYWRLEALPATVVSSWSIGNFEGLTLFEYIIEVDGVNDQLSFTCSIDCRQRKEITILSEVYRYTENNSIYILSPLAIKKEY